MASSTTTLIEAANAILLSINERPLPNLSTVVGQQVKACLQTALQALVEETDWTWLEVLTYATSWDSVGTATLPESIQRIRLVQYLQKNGTWLIVPFLDSDTYDSIVPQPFTVTQTGFYPTYYTLIDWNKVELNPYPTDPLDQARVRFKCVNRIYLPSIETSTLDMPEHFIQALIKRGAQEFALRHAEDFGLSQAFAQNYNQEIQSLRNRHRQGQTNSYSMYKGARNRE